MIFLGELSGYLYKAKKHAALTEVIGETEKYIKGFLEMAIFFHKQLLPENEFLKNVIQCGDNTMMEIEL